MGNLCYKIMKWKLRNEDLELSAVNNSSPRTFSSEDTSWEEKQRKRNAKTEATVLEDFTSNPENFILNMLVLSTPFYKEFDQEILEASRVTEDRERYFTNKLVSSRRQALFLGAIEEIAGTHILYKDPRSSLLELPIKSQLFIIQENIYVLSEEEHKQQQDDFEEDIEVYTDEIEDTTECPVVEEPVKKHPGFVYLRSTEVLRRLSNGNIQDKYSISIKSLENESDLFIDSNSSFSPSQSNKSQDDLPEMTFLQVTKEEQYAKTERRPSGVLPKGFNWKEERESLKRDETDENKFNGIFPKLNPGMEKEQVTKSNIKILQPTGEEFVKLRSILAKIDDETEENIFNESKVNKQSLKANSNKLKNATMSYQSLGLSSTIKRDCFIKKISETISESKKKWLISDTNIQAYLSSTRYMKRFENEFLQILKILQKDHFYNTSILEMVSIQTTNILDKKYGPKFTTEYIPSILMNKWPHCALEWKRRIRKIKNNSETQTTHNKWPSIEKIEEIIKAGCNLVPLGYNNPRKPSNTFDIEWQIQFSNAEKVLLSSLGHSQIRILLLAQLLIRDHLGEKTLLRNQHLRYILFYMCECNMGDWEEERLGLKLKSFMKSLHSSLAKENFPHYFVSHCNMIDSIPETDLKQIQMVLKKITENLPLYLMHSLYCLRASKDFYHRLDIKKLYQIITPKKFHETNIQTLKDFSSSDEDTSSEISDEGEELKKYLERRYSKQPKSQPQVNISKIKNFDLCSKVQTLSDNRAKEVLKYFADRFIKMARQSNEFGVYNQAFKYLTLTENMSTLLKDYNCVQESNSYKEIVEKIKIVTRKGLANRKKSKFDSISLQRKLSNASRDSSKPINLQQYLDEKQKIQETKINTPNAEVKKVKPSKLKRYETIIEESDTDDEEQMTAC